MITKIKKYYNEVNILIETFVLYTLSTESVENSLVDKY